MVDDSLSVSKFKDQVGEVGIPTVASAYKQKEEAESLFDAEKWVEAEAAYKALADNANFLANIISQGLRPYYSASHDGQTNLSRDVIRKLAPDEELSDHYKMVRNVAFLRMGICFFNMKAFEDALPLLMKSLDLISIDEYDDWRQARKYLYDIIGYDNCSKLERLDF